MGRGIRTLVGALVMPSVTGSCECALWRRRERCTEMASVLVAGGFIDDDDQADAAVAIAKLLHSWGALSAKDVAHVRLVGLESWQRKAVDAYVRKASETNDTTALSSVIHELGVHPRTLAGWARKFFGPGYLASVRPVSGMALMRAELKRNPWQTRRELRRKAGVSNSAFSGAAHYALSRGTLMRRRNEQGLWEYAVP